MFRRDSRFNVSPAAQQRLAVQDALRGYVPEPPGAPQAPRLAVAFKGHGSVSGSCSSGGDACYAHRLVRDYGPTRAVLTARAEGREVAAALIEAGVALARARR